MLGDAKVDEHGNITDAKDYNTMYLDKEGEDREIDVSSFILVEVCLNYIFHQTRDGYYYPE